MNLSSTTGLQGSGYGDSGEWFRRCGLVPLQAVQGLSGGDPAHVFGSRHDCGAEQVAVLGRFPVIPCARPAAGIHDNWSNALVGDLWKPYWVVDARIVHRLNQIPEGFRDATIPEAVLALVYHPWIGSTRVRVGDNRTVQVYFDGGIKIVEESDDVARHGLFGDEGPTHHLLSVALNGVVHQ